jgi:phosphonate transport system permease protein
VSTLLDRRVSTLLDRRVRTLLDRSRLRARAGAPPRRPAVTRAAVLRRRALTLVGLTALVGWAWLRALPEDGRAVNGSAGALLRDLGARALHPELGAEFLQLVWEATLTTLAFAALGAAGALLLGLVGGLVLSDVAWSGRVPAPWRAVRALLRGVLVAVRSVHELIWALLLVTVLGLDPLVAVLALVIPFGAQTAQVFGETFDSTDTRAYRELRNAGAPRTSALAYALVPAASPLLLSYSFYRFECSVRSTVLLGFVGVGGLGQELVISLQSRNWEEVWTLVHALLLLSALVEVWSARVRREVAAPTAAVTAAPEAVRRSDAEGAVASVATASRQGAGRAARRTRRTWSRVTLVGVLPVLVLSWWAADLTLAGLTDPLTWQLTRELLGELMPPALPDGGAAALLTAVLDTVAMAVLAMTLAVLTTLSVGAAAAGRSLLRLPARFVLLVLRSVPPTVWAVLALFVLFPGVLPGALALGLYAGGILGRLVAEAWEGQDRSAVEALERTGTPRWLAGLAAVVPVSVRQVVTYTLYRFEVSIRDTTVVGVVGAAGLGRLLAEALASFRFPVVASLLVASFALSAAVELTSRRVRRALTT